MVESLLGLCVSCFLAAPLAAQDSMSAAQFEEVFEGRTVPYMFGDMMYGTEWYKPGRRVTWRAEHDASCVEGVWYPNENGEICFDYEDHSGEICWEFVQTDLGIRATVTSDVDGSVVSGESLLVDPREPDGELVCPNHGF